MFQPLRGKLFLQLVLFCVLVVFACRVCVFAFVSFVFVGLVCFVHLLVWLFFLSVFSFCVFLCVCFFVRQTVLLLSLFVGF